MAQYQEKVGCPIIMENSMETLKTLDVEAQHNQQAHCRRRTQRKWDQDLRGCLPSRVHCSIVHNSLYAHCGWTDKENGVRIHGGILFNHKKEILPFLTTQMNLEAIMLSKINMRKTNTALPHLSVESKNTGLTELD